MKKIHLSDEDLKEIFSLFSSPTKFEKKQIYDEKSKHYFRNVNIQEEYNLNQEIKEFSLDAWRSVLYFLFSKGFSISKNDSCIDLSFVEDEFLD